MSFHYNSPLLPLLPLLSVKMRPPKKSFEQCKSKICNQNFTVHVECLGWLLYRSDVVYFMKYLFSNPRCSLDQAMVVSWPSNKPTVPIYGLQQHVTTSWHRWPYHVITSCTLLARISSYTRCMATMARLFGSLKLALVFPPLQFFSQSMLCRLDKTPSE